MYLSAEQSSAINPNLNPNRLLIRSDPDKRAVLLQLGLGVHDTLEDLQRGVVSAHAIDDDLHKFEFPFLFFRKPNRRERSDQKSLRGIAIKDFWPLGTRPNRAGSVGRFSNLGLSLSFAQQRDTRYGDTRYKI